MKIDWRRLYYKSVQGGMAASLQWYLTYNTDEQLQQLLEWWVRWWYTHTQAHPEECRKLLPSLEFWSPDIVREVITEYAQVGSDVNDMDFAFEARDFFCDNED